MTSNNFSALSLKGYQLCQKNFFFYSILANLHTTTYKNKTKSNKKLRTTQAHDLVTPYMAMEVTRDEHANDISYFLISRSHLHITHNVSSRCN